MSLDRLAGALVAALFLVVLVAAPALAAPQRLASDPEPGAELHEAPEQVTITLSEPVDESSEIRVFDDCDRRLDDRKTQTNLNEMSVGIELTPSGTYTVAYVAVGVTGTARDAFAFTVLHAGPACDGSDGGHEGHGGDKDGGDGKDGDGHAGHDPNDPPDDHEGHDGADDDGTGHTDHDNTVAGSGDHHGDNHAGEGHGGKGHGDHRNGKNETGNNAADEEGTTDVPIAAGENLLPQPGGSTAVMALGIAMLFGLVGGWVLRVSGAR